MRNKHLYKPSKPTPHTFLWKYRLKNPYFSSKNLPFFIRQSTIIIFNRKLHLKKKRTNPQSKINSHAQLFPYRQSFPLENKTKTEMLFMASENTEGIHAFSTETRNRQSTRMFRNWASRRIPKLAEFSL